MAAISYESLFDFPGYNKAIKDAESANKEFGKVVETINARIAAQYSEIKTELSEYMGVLKSFNVNQKNAAQAIIQTGEAALVTGKKVQEQQRIMEDLTETTNLNTKSVNDLKMGLKGLEAEYNSIEGKEEKDIKRKKEIAAQVIRVTGAIKEQTQAIKVTSKVLDTAEGSYQAMQNEMNGLIKKLKAMPDAFDKTTGKINLNNKAAADLQTRIIGLNGTLTTADTTMGKFSRNVGNYASGFTGLNQSFGQLARELPALAINVQTFFLAISNNLPIFFDQLKQTKLEIAAMRAEGLKAPSMLQAMGKAIFNTGTLLTIGVTLLTLYGKNVVDFVDKLFKGSKELTAFEKNQKLVNEVFKEASKAVGDDIVKLNIYKDKLNDLNIPATQRVKVAKEYNKTADETNKIDLTQINNLDLINQKISAQNDLIIKRAISVAAMSKLTEASSKLVDAELELNQALKNTGLTEEKVKDQTAKGINSQLLARDRQTKSLDGYGKKVGQVSNANVVAVSKETLAVNTLIDARNAAKRNVESLTNSLSPLITTDGLTTDPGESKTKSGKSASDKLAEDVKKQQEILKAELETSLAEINQIRAKDIIDEEDYQMAKLGLVKQYASAAVEQEERKGKKIDLKTIEELKKAKIDAETEYINFLKDANAEKIERKKRDIESEAKDKIVALNEEKDLVLDSQKFTAQEKTAINLDYQNRADDILIDSLKRRILLETDAEKKSALEREKIQLENGIGKRNGLFDNDSAALAAAKLFQQKLYQLEEDFAQKRSQGILRNKLQDDIDYLEAQLELYKENAEKKAEIERDLKEIGIQQYAELLQAKSQLVSDVENGITELLTTILTGRFESELALLDQQKQRELQLAGNNNQAKAAIEESFAKKENDIKFRKAKAERTAALFKIAVDAAMKVFEIQATAAALLSNPFTAPYAAVAFSQIPFVLASAGVAAGLVLAKPLPKFKHGTKNSPEGLAMVDEAGPELIIDKSGRLKEIGGDQGPRVTYLEKGSQVIPHMETKQLLKGMATAEILNEGRLIQSMANKFRTAKSDEMTYAIVKAIQSGAIDQQSLSEAFEKAVKKIPVQNHIYDERGYRKRIDEVNSKTTYLNNLTKL